MGSTLISVMIQILVGFSDFRVVSRVLWDVAI